MIKAPFLIFSILIALTSGSIPLRAQNGDARDDVDDPLLNAVVRVAGCSGTLITDHIVLTAAHCVPNKLRQKKPPGAKREFCDAMPAQFKLQSRPWEDPFKWYEIPLRKRASALIGGKREQPRMRALIDAYSLPRCADMALFRLTRKVPAGIAIPMKVMTELPIGSLTTDQFMQESQLRYAGWGLGKKKKKELPLRQTGRVDYWDDNACSLFTLPPERAGGKLIVSGDSGSPLLLTHGGAERVAGVLFGSGLPDPEICGHPTLRPPKKHGNYTPTYRRAVEGSDATDIAAWIAFHAPNAVYHPDPIAN